METTKSGLKDHEPLTDIEALYSSMQDSIRCLRDNSLVHQS